MATKLKLNDKEKLKLAVEALEFYMKWRLDSRNFGFITTRIEDTLKKLKE